MATSDVERGVRSAVVNGMKYGVPTGAESDPQNAPNLAPRPRLRLARFEITIHEFGRHRHHDQSKNPAYHTTESKLAARRAVRKVTAIPSIAR